MLAAAIVAAAAGSATAVPVRDSVPGERTVVGDLRIPWDVDFLPDGSAVVSERDTGRILHLVDGRVASAWRIEDVVVRGDAGVMGLAVSPDYERDRRIYVFYSTARDHRIGWFRLGEQPRPILTGIPRDDIINGGALAFGPDGMLYAGTGSGRRGTAAQDLDSLSGKILRMTRDGRPAPGNPFPGSLVYSYGHRNVQGLAWGPDGTLYATDIGDVDWDEINRVVPGGNHGWPLCEGRCDRPDTVQPVATMRPADAVPSGIAHHQGWLYVSNLRGERVTRFLILADGELSGPYRVISGMGRMRAATVTRDGSLWLTTSNQEGKGTTRAAHDDRVLQVRLG